MKMRPRRKRSMKKFVDKKNRCSRIYGPSSTRKRIRIQRLWLQSRRGRLQRRRWWRNGSGGGSPTGRRRNRWKKTTMKWKSNLKMNPLPSFQHGPRTSRAAARVCQKTDLSTTMSPRPRLTCMTMLSCQRSSQCSGSTTNRESLWPQRSTMRWWRKPSESGWTWTTSVLIQEKTRMATSSDRRSWNWMNSFSRKGRGIHGQKERSYNSGRPRNMMMPVIKTLEIYEKMMEFLVRAGYTPESLGFLMPMNRMQADAQGKQEMRVTISNFLRRLLKGTFPEHESYTFSRSGSHGFPNCIELPAFSVYLSLREKEQRVELLFCSPTMWHSFTSKLCQQDGLCYSAGRGRGAEGKDRNENEDGSNPWRRSGEWSIQSGWTYCSF